MTEDVILEVARWAREAEAATVAKLAAGQHGEAFVELEKESDHAISNHH